MKTEPLERLCLQILCEIHYVLYYYLLSPILSLMFVWCLL